MPNPDCSRFPYPNCQRCSHYNECKRKCNPTPTPVGSCALSGIQSELTSNPGGTILDNANIAFNNNIISDNPNIARTSTDQYTITKIGDYLVNFSVSIDGTESNPYANLSIIVNGNIYEQFSLPVVTGLLSGSSLIAITSIPSTVNLKNTSGETILLASNPIQANMNIVGLNCN